MACGSSSGVGCYGGGHPCIILCPGHGSDGGGGGRDSHGEKKAKYSALVNYARLRSRGYGDLRSNQRHWPGETCFLLQRLSITIQRFNSVAFRGTLPALDLRESQL